MDAEDLLFILYTSGTTGKPKGIVHTTGGYLTHVTSTAKHVFDLNDDDVYWCTADVGWVTGHSYVVYGPLANGATVLMYEGAPDWPERDRFWRLVETYGVTILYTAPTAIRAFMKWGTEHPGRHDLSTLRLLGSVGEPINPEAWIWYHEHIGRKRCPIVDTWWQTETGGIMITPLPAVSPPRSRARPRSPIPGIAAELVDTHGKRAGDGRRVPHHRRSRGRACCGRSTATTSATARSTGAGSPAGTSPATAPSSTRTATGGSWAAWTTCSTSPGTGSARWRSRARWWTTRPWPRPRWWAGRTSSRARRWRRSSRSRTGTTPSAELKDELKAHVTQKIGAIARPDEIFFSADLPKTRSGKIMRRLLKDIAEGRALGDTTTLADPAVVSRLKDMYESQEA